VQVTHTSLHKENLSNLIQGFFYWLMVSPANTLLISRYLGKNYVHARGGSDWVLGRASQKEWCCSGTAAQGGGGVTVTGGVPEPCGCGTEGAGMVLLGWGWTGQS